MTTYTYPAHALAPDYARAGAGFAVTAAPLPWLTGSPVAFTILGVLALAFGAFAVATGLRHMTAVRIGPGGISTSGPRHATVSWVALQKVELRYFSTRRDREKGWMQLRIAGEDGSVSVDSALDGFVDVARRAAEAAADRNLDLSQATRENLRALGIALHRPARPGEGEPA